MRFLGSWGVGEYLFEVMVDCVLNDIGSVEWHMEEGETHGSTQVKYQRQILEDLLRVM